MTIEPSGFAGSHAAYAGTYYPDQRYAPTRPAAAEPAPYPGSSYPGSSYPGSSHSGTSYPDSNYLGGDHGNTGYPDPGFSSAGYADAGYGASAYRDRVHVYEWQFYILDGEQSGYPWRENNNGLVALSSGLAVFTGTGTGQVPVSVEVCDAPPPLEYDGWDEIVEVSYYTARGDARICSWQGEPAAGLPVVSRYGPGTYRIRAHAKGRDTSRDALRVLADEFRFVVWPAPGEATTIHKTTDDVGRVLRAGFSSAYHYH